MPELPWERRRRYVSMGLKDEDAALFVADRRFGDFLDTVTGGLEELGSISLTANYLANDVVKIIRDIEEREAKSNAEIPISAQSFKEIIRMAFSKEISSRGAKDLLLRVVTDARNPREIATDEGMFGGVGKDLSAVVVAVLEQNKRVVEDFKAGKTAALQYLVGQGMKATRGAVDPETLREAIRKQLS